MALPVILVDSTAGGASDTQASGAGPSTAPFGTTDASFATATVTLTAGTDLSGVSTLGDHVLYLLTSTGVRFFKITGSAGSGGATPTVDVTPNPAGTSTGRTWAIGGKRATAFSASSKLLFDNGGSSGDAMPGWIVEMQSAHAESISSAVDLRRAGDATSGRIILRGASGAVTLPKITVTANVNAFVLRGAFQTLDGFEIEAASSAVTSAVTDASADANICRKIKLSRTSTNVFTTGFSGVARVESCEIQRCGVGIVPMTSSTIINNKIHDCTGNGIGSASDFLGLEIYVNEFWNIGGDAINQAYTGAATRAMTVAHNSGYNITGDFIELTSAPSAAMVNLRIFNNICDGCLYGIKFSHASSTLVAMQAYDPFIHGNDFYNVTSGNDLPDGIDADGLALDPQYVSGSTGDLSIGTNLKAKGYPVAGTLPIGGNGTVYSYVDPGAAQRQEAGGGSGMLVHPGMGGRLV